MQKRLSSWKGRNLTFAGRLVLIKSVISSIPIYIMNTVKLSVAVCNDIDKIKRNFLWSGSDNKNSTHVVNWDDVCKRKEDEGLGIKQARPMNLALLSKLSWIVKEEHNNLWVRTVKARCPNESKRSQTDSSTWRGILQGLKSALMKVPKELATAKLPTFG